MDEVSSLRERHGEGYASLLQDGTLVPWRPLSIKEYLLYDQLAKSRRYPLAYLEDEIFRKCVLNEFQANNLGKLRAGVVTQVANAIFLTSIPQTTEALSIRLDEKRAQVDAALHDLVCFVCQAFPGYTPDQLYAMDADTLMSRVALAERKMLSTGIIKEPLELYQVNPQQRQTTPVKATPPKQNLAKAYQAQKQTIITKAEAAEVSQAYTGHDKTDKIVLEDKMVGETAGIYKEYIDQLKQGKPLVIKSPEERRAAAVEKAKENELLYLESLKRTVSTKKEEQLNKLAQERKMKRAAQRNKR